MWKILPEFENRYKIDEYGNVYSFYSKKLIKTWLNHRGYVRISLRLSDKARKFSIHRLVAKAFIPISQSLLDQGYDYDTLQVNHLDENKLNNYYTNLEWCTPSQNMNHGTAIIRAALSKSTYIDMLDANGNILKTFSSMAEANRQLGIPQQNIYKCCKGRRNQAGGYGWQYHQFTEQDDCYFRPVLKINPITLEIIQEYPSVMDAYKQHTNLMKSVNGWHSILSCCYGEIPLAYGYKWKFK